MAGKARRPFGAVLLITCLGLLASQSSAEPNAFSCKFIGPAEMANSRDALMDHLVVDPVKNRVDLQVANSMGTSKQIDWTLVDHSVEQDDRFVVIRGSGDNFVGVGTNFGNPTILTFKDGVLRWLTFTDSGLKAGETIYRCGR